MRLTLPAWLSGLFGKSGGRSRRDKRSQRRPRVVPLWRRRWARVGTAATLVLGVAAGGWWIWESKLPHRLAAGVVASVLDMTADFGFSVSEVFVVGRRQTESSRLRRALAVDTGDPILSVDLQAARERIESLPWIKSVTIERLLPDAIVVRLIERRPFVLWQDQGRFALIDAEGHVIARKNLASFRDLLLVVGPDAPEHAVAACRTPRHRTRFGRAR